MIVGAMKTLVEVEGYVANAIIKNDKARNEMKRELGFKQQKVNTMTRVAVDDNGKQYGSPEYTKEWNEFQQMQRDFQAMHDKADWLKHKAAELEGFENEAKRRGLFTTKAEYKVELTLGDLQYLDIPSEELHPKGPVDAK